MRRAFSDIRFSESRQAWGEIARSQAKLMEEYCARKQLFRDDSLDLCDSGQSAFRRTTRRLAPASRSGTTVSNRGSKSGLTPGELTTAARGRSPSAGRRQPSRCPQMFESFLRRGDPEGPPSRRARPGRRACRADAPGGDDLRRSLRGRGHARVIARIFKLPLLGKRMLCTVLPGIKPRL